MVIQAKPDTITLLKCPIDEKLMMAWYAAHEAKVGIKEARQERAAHRRTCPVCKERMRYFKAMMEK